jgi:uncharacterized lipoprotein YajG
MKTIILAGAMFALLTGCATPPTRTNFANSVTVQKPFDEVWEELVGFFASRNIPLKNIAKDSGVIYAETLSIDSSFANCGKYPLMSPRQSVMSVNVFVQRKNDAQVVSVNTSARQTLVGPYNSVQTVECFSTGALEQSVLNSVR